MPGLLYDSDIWGALSFAAHPFHDLVAEHAKQASAEAPVCRVRATELSALRLLTTQTVHRAYGVPYLGNRVYAGVIWPSSCPISVRPKRSSSYPLQKGVCSRHLF